MSWVDPDVVFVSNWVADLTFVGPADGLPNAQQMMVAEFQSLLTWDVATSTWKTMSDTSTVLTSPTMTAPEWELGPPTNDAFPLPMLDVDAGPWPVRYSAGSPSVPNDVDAHTRTQTISSEDSPSLQAWFRNPTNFDDPGLYIQANADVVFETSVAVRSTAPTIWENELHTHNVVTRRASVLWRMKLDAEYRPLRDPSGTVTWHPLLDRSAVSTAVAGTPWTAALPGYPAVMPHPVWQDAVSPWNAVHDGSRYRTFHDATHGSNDTVNSRPNVWSPPI